jgi:hypothetical protein
VRRRHWVVPNQIPTAETPAVVEQDDALYVIFTPRPLGPSSPDTPPCTVVLPTGQHLAWLDTDWTEQLATVRFETPPSDTDYLDISFALDDHADRTARLVPVDPGQDSRTILVIHSDDPDIPRDNAGG